MDLAPHFIREIDGVHVLWFKNSNRYLVLDNKTLNLLKAYYKSSNKREFISEVDNSFKYEVQHASQIFDDLSLFLTECNKGSIKPEVSPIKLNKEKKWLHTSYKLHDKLISVYYSGNRAKGYFHPNFSYSELHYPTKETYHTFYIDNISNEFLLYSNEEFIGSYKENNSHLLQGQFAMELLNVLYDKHEDDWLGTFHATSISNNKQAVMLIGESGKGKSTLGALLMSNGLNLVCDDFTPMLAENQHIYSYPSAVSIKEGAFKFIKNYFPDFENIETLDSQTSKGQIKYLAPLNNLHQPDVPCNKIVWVNYKKNKKTSLEKVPLQLILDTLISDSWLSPKPENAERFLNWLNKTTFYRLTYSNNNEVIDIFKNELLV